MKTLISVAVAIGLFAAVGTALAAEQTPQGFMEHLYQEFETGPMAGKVDWARAQAGDAFDPSLAALIRRYTAAADKAGDVGLDYVPFCGCNDDSGLHYAVKASAPSGDKATAVVTVTSSAKGQKPFLLRYDLVKTQAGWRVSDIRSKETPSLRKQVADNLRSEYNLPAR